MIQDFQNILVFSVDLAAVLQNLLVALICGLIIALVYRTTYKGPSYSKSFVQALVLLSLITAVVILVIDNNLARAFGLVGAMSIIRFRTAVKDTQDIVFIFFSLVIGMAAGVGMSQIAVLATLFISIVILIMLKANFGKEGRHKLLLQIVYNAPPESNAELVLTKIINQYCKKLQLVNLKHTGFQEEMEAHYHVLLVSNTKHGQLVRALKELPHVQTVQIFFDEEENLMT